MSDVARLLLARGQTLADLARARSQIWGNAVENIAQLPLQIQQQAQQQKRIDALTLLEQARAQREQGLYDQAQKTAQRADALHQNMLQVYRRAYSGDPANPDFDEARRAATEIGDPDVIDATESWIEKRQPQIEPAAPGSMARYKTGPQAGQTVPGSLVPEKPPAPSEAGFAADLSSPDPAVRARAQTAIDAIQAPRKAQEAETNRHNAAMEQIGRLQVGRAEAAQRETARHNAAMETAANPLAALLGGTATAPPSAAPTSAQPAGAPAVTPTTAPTPAPTGQPQAGLTGLTGQALLDRLPPQIASQVKAYAEGRMPFPGGFALKSPYFQSMIQLVGQYDPSFDAINYNARSKTRNDFTSGKSAQTINALNTVTQHLNRLSDSADALNNTWSPTYNSIANMVSRLSGNKTVTNFETDKKAVVDELTRAWRQAGGSEGDIKSWSAVLDAANSPAQLHGAIGEMGHLLEGKLSALENQYQQGMGTTAVKAITPEARQVLTKLEQRAGGKTQAAPVVGERRLINGRMGEWDGTGWKPVGQ